MIAEATTLITLEARQAAKSAQEFLAQMRAVRVLSEADYKSAGSFLRQVKEKAKELDDIRFSLTRPLDAQKAEIMDFFRGPSGFLAEAEKVVKASMADFQRQQEEIRKEAERKARAAAEEERRKAEEARIAAEAEARRKAEEAAELQRKAEASTSPVLAAIARAAAEATQAQAAEQAEVLREAILAEHGVEKSIQAAIPVAPKAYGTSARRIWKHKVVNAALVPREFLVVDESKLAAYAKAMKETAVVPGVEFFEDISIAAR